jgi:hypothetical protein
MVRRQLEGLAAHVNRIAPSRPLLVCVLLFGLSFFASGGTEDRVRYLVGVHYYVWHPENFADGYLRGVLRPAQTPGLGGEGGRRGPALDDVATRLTRDQLIRQVLQGGGEIRLWQEP